MHAKCPSEFYSKEEKEIYNTSSLSYTQKRMLVFFFVFRCIIHTIVLVLPIFLLYQTIILVCIIIYFFCWLQIIPKSILNVIFLFFQNCGYAMFGPMRLKPIKLSVSRRLLLYLFIFCILCVILCSSAKKEIFFWWVGSVQLIWTSFNLPK